MGQVGFITSTNKEGYTQCYGGIATDAYDPKKTLSYHFLGGGTVGRIGAGSIARRRRRRRRKSDIYETLRKMC
jgi:hypothetical protein